MLDEETRRRLEAVGFEVEIPAGQVLIEHNTPASGLYLIIEGRVAIHAHGAELEGGFELSLVEMTVALEAKIDARPGDDDDRRVVGHGALLREHQLFDRVVLPAERRRNRPVALAARRAGETQTPALARGRNQSTVHLGLHLVQRSDSERVSILSASF